MIKKSLSEVLEDAVKEWESQFQDLDKREVFLNITSASDEELLENGLVRVELYNKLRTAAEKACTLLEDHLSLTSINERWFN